METDTAGALPTAALHEEAMKASSRGAVGEETNTAVEGRRIPDQLQQRVSESEWVGICLRQVSVHQRPEMALGIEQAEPYSNTNPGSE